MTAAFTTPIIMSAPMIRALLDGRKTQTRRLPTNQWRNLKKHFDQGERCFVWVRETWGSPDADHPRCHDGRKPQSGDRLVFQANPGDAYQWGSGRPSQGGFCWRPSIHMPRWASRLTLEVTDVRIQQLQDISEADAVAEGIFWQEPTAEDHEYARENSGYDAQGVWIAPGTDCGFGPKEHRQQWHVRAALAYGLLWDHLHGQGSWDANPDIVAISFRCHRQNIDALLADRGVA